MARLAPLARGQMDTDLGLELQIAVDVIVLVRCGAGVAELEDHLAE